jgi:hypothetical protein
MKPNATRRVGCCAESQVDCASCLDVRWYRGGARLLLRLYCFPARLAQTSFVPRPHQTARAHHKRTARQFQVEANLMQFDCSLLYATFFFTALLLPPTFPAPARARPRTWFAALDCNHRSEMGGGSILPSPYTTPSKRLRVGYRAGESDTPFENGFESRRVVCAAAGCQLPAMPFHGT